MPIMTAEMLPAVAGVAWAGLGSTIGACAAWSPWLPGRRVQASLLGFAAGVMLAAALLSLLPQAMASGGLLPVLGGFLAGLALIAALDHLLPHQHPGAPEPDHRRGEGMAASTAVLIVLALILHNIPEGLAVGVSAASASAEHGGGRSVVAAIALHNIVEGILVAVPLRLAGFSNRLAFAIGLGAGLAEVIAGVAAALLLGDGGWLVPAGLACAAGAMVFVVFEELLPEALRAGAGNIAPIGATLGVTLVVVLKSLGG